MRPTRLTVLLLVSFLCSAAAATDMSAEQLRGQQIYLHGQGADGVAIQASLNGGNVQVPASIVPCVSCHGHDGLGKAEGGYVPSDLRWSVLTRPYDVTHASGRPHRPYDEKSVKRAIAMGFDSSGNELNAVMPRYSLSLHDMEDLVAYLKGLGTFTITGVGEKIINVGVILSRDRHKAEAVRSILEAYFGQINSHGGIYQRQIKLVSLSAPAPDRAGLEKFAAQLESADIFALVASEVDDVQPFISAYSERTSTPLVGSFSRFPNVAFPLNRYIFYLFGGYRIQSLSLAVFAKEKYALETPKIRILTSNDGYYHDTAGTIAARWEESQRPEVITLDGDNGKIAEIVTSLRAAAVKQIFFLGNLALQAEFIAEADRQQWWPQLLLPAMHMSRQLFGSPVGFDGRVFVALPALPLDYDESALAEYQNLLEEYDLPDGSANSQLWTIAAVNILVEGLTRVGSALSQEKLVDALEALYQFDTTTTRPVTYGPNQRIGISGSYIVSVDVVRHTIMPVSSWVSIR